MAAQAAANSIRFLTVAQIQRLHVTSVIFGAQASQPDLLESAINSPMNVSYYNQTDDEFELAAILSEKLIKNHAFQDGNKRTALVAADMFLRVNGCRLQDTPTAKGATELANAHVAVATSQWTPQQLAACYGGVSDIR